MFLKLYLLELTFIKRIKKSKAPAMKKRTHLRAIFQRVLTMKITSVGNAMSNLIYSFLKSFVLDTTMIKIIFGIPIITITIAAFAIVFVGQKTAILAIGPKLTN